MPTTTETCKPWTIPDVPKPLKHKVKAQAAARGLKLSGWLEQAAALWEIHKQQTREGKE
jgi:hypothetical protein